MPIRFLSLFSGIEAASAAWHPLGWECVGVSEIEPFPCNALAHHWPNVPNIGDVTKVTEAQIAALGRIDVLVFGSPCQDLSVAGKRKGLDGERSGLFFAAMRIVGWARKHCGLRFAAWENVPGAFTSNDGHDFAAVVAALAGIAEPPAPPPKGWGTEGCCVGEEAMVEWSTLDAQWFGVAQRRRRVFAVADFGDWRGRPPILLEPESLRGDSAPRRGPWESVTATASGRAVACGDGNGPVQLAFGGNNTSGPIEVAAALNANRGCINPGDFEAGTLVVLAFKASHFTRGKDGAPSLVSPPLSADADKGDQDVLVLDLTNKTAVRRLTPRECERLQGFPEGHTLISPQIKDTPRYKALGNSMCVNVMLWIGQRIDFVYHWFGAADEDLFA